MVDILTLEPDRYLKIMNYFWVFDKSFSTAVTWQARATFTHWINAAHIWNQICPAYNSTLNIKGLSYPIKKPKENQTTTLDKAPNTRIIIIIIMILPVCGKVPTAWASTEIFFCSCLKNVTIYEYKLDLVFVAPVCECEVFSIQKKNDLLIKGDTLRLNPECGRN